MIVCVGAATRDTIYSLPHYPAADERVVATERVVAGGGPAATAAVAIARLGVDVRFVGAIDGDLDGVDVVRVPGRMIESTILVTPEARAIVTVDVRPFVAPPDALEGAEWVHVDHVGYASIPNAGGFRLSVDGGNPIPGLELDAVELYALEGKLARA